jgi:hypothetical protein
MDVNVDAGATVEGDKSGQSFIYSDLDVDDRNVTILRLKMVGIKKEIMNKSIYKYCTNCGYKIKRNAKYCSECGHHRENCC